MPILNSHDTHGYYYKFGTTGKKYYYNSPQTKKNAYSKTLRQARAIERSKHLHGGFLNQDARGPKAFRDWVEQYQNVRIIRLLAGRKPLFSTIEKLANFVSAGKYEQAKHKYNIEQLFHLFLFMELENGEGWIIQKNEILDARQERPSNDSGLMGINIPNDLTVGKLIHPAIQIMGDKFATYDAQSNNCQDFINTILRGAGLLTPELHKFIKQNTEEIANTIPSVAKFFAKFAIGLARKFDVLLHGGNMNEDISSLYLSLLLKSLQ